LSATTSVFYSNVSATTLTPTEASLTITPSGGTPPYYSSLSGDISWGPAQSTGSIEYSMSGFTSNRHATLKVTDSGSPQQSATISVFVPVPRAYPEEYIQTAALSLVSATESLASSLCPAGISPCGVRDALRQQLGITSSQYS
jgi:hypothetical protein